MLTTIRKFDPLWNTFPAEDLRKIAASWGASAKIPKADRISYLIGALKDPVRIDGTLKDLLPHQLAMLSLLRMMGGIADIAALGIAVRAAGMAPAADRDQLSYGIEPMAKSLLERGLIMLEGGYEYIGYGYYGGEKEAFADDRLLARLKPQDYSRLSLQAADEPATSTYRRVPNVMLELISILRTVEDIGGIGMTQAGVPRVNDMRKVARKLDWGDQIAIDGLTFPEPLNAYIFSMESSGLLALRNGALMGVVSMDEFVRSRPTEIVRHLMQGVLQANQWLEVDAGQIRYMYQHHCQTSRFAVVAALRCLPDRTAWFRFADFERALFERVGELRSIAGMKPQPHVSFHKTADEQRIALEAWKQETRAAWEQNHVPWLQAVFRTWLYAFGLVELHLIDGIVDCFRLTDLGQAILWDEELPEQAQPPESQSSAWIVQPNFDVMVYLASASTEQIAFLEQYADRMQVAQHIAQYRLTRDSVYEGLQRGGSVDQLIERLTAGSRVGLPSNVQSEIQTWATLRERITLRKRTDLIEFTDATERQNAITAGLQGLSVGDRFLLLPENHRPSSDLKDEINYAHQPDNRSLVVAHDGVVQLRSTPASLLTQGGLDLWAERENAFTWRLTRKSVEQAVQRGRKFPELQAFLNERTMVSIPGLLMIALQAWSGARAQTSLSHAVILQSAQPAVLEAILQSPALKPHLISRIGLDTVLIKSEDEASVRAVLEWAGVQVSATILTS